MAAGVAQRVVLVARRGRLRQGTGKSLVQCGRSNLCSSTCAAYAARASVPNREDQSTYYINTIENAVLRKIAARSGIDTADERLEHLPGTRIVVTRHRCTPRIRCRPHTSLDRSLYQTGPAARRGRR